MLKISTIVCFEIHVVAFNLTPDCRSIARNIVFDSKTLSLAMYDPRSSIAKSVFDCRLSCVKSGR